MARRQSITDADDALRPPAATRAECALLLVLVLAGAGLRFAWPARMAIEHFDEGVYASNIWFAPSAGQPESDRYPARHLYAPPLLPALIEWSIIFFGFAPWSVKLASLLAGTATIPLAWWAARRWFGIEAGMAAAALVAFSDFHILLSRMALTDALLGFWLLAAVYGASEMFARGRPAWGIAAGLATGLAWSTKYNGWLPLAIAASGYVFYRLAAGKKNAPWGAALISLGVMALTALAIWSQVWLGLQHHGGYSAVAANHRGYLVGPEGWWPSLVRQVGNHRYLDGWLSCAAPGMAVIVAWFARRCIDRGFTWNAPAAGAVSGRHEARDRCQWCEVAALVLLVTGGAALLGSSVAIGMLAIGGLGVHLWRRSSEDAATLPACLLAAWLAGLALATPFYHPYPRLTLPWLLAAWLGAASLIGWSVRDAAAERSAGTGSSGRRRLSRLVFAGSAALFAVALFVSAGRLTERGIAGWQPQTGLRDIAAEIVRDVEQSGVRGDGVIQVYAEPALFFQLRVALAQDDSHIAVVPAGSIAPPRVASSQPLFLATGPNAHREAAYRAAMGEHRGRFRLVARYRYRPSDLVLLNAYTPRELRAADPPEEEVRLYRVE